MKRVSLATAVGHIKQVCDENLKLGDKPPFFLLVGSGLSYPQVPLASQIEESCKLVARSHARPTEPDGKRLIDTYSHWFDQAYPHPIERQRYLRSLIEGKSISQANVRLAHLLLERRLANLVITTNFDDFLSRALTLFGKPHIVCDHPRTVERINAEADDIQIVHVHGTYWFYDCCNLAGEIEERSRPSSENSLTMASLLDTILARRSPLVVGYGGWEGDVVMCALKRRLQNRLPYNLYWFCYREAEAAAMPKELREHPDVYFVVPDGPVESTPTPAGANPKPDEPPVVSTATQGIEPVLRAQKVFDKLILAFNLDAPKLTSDPLGYFAGYLKQSLPGQDGLSAESDIYSMESVIADIEAARDRTRTKGALSKMEQIRDRARRSHYREAIRLGSEMASGKLPARETRELLRIMLSAAWRLDDSSAEEIAGYDVVIRLGKSFPPSDEYVRERVAMAMVNKGLSLAGANRHDDAIKVFEEASERFGKERGLFFRQQVAEAMFNRAFSLSAMGSQEKAIQAYGDVIRRLSKADEPELQEMVAMSLLNRGFIRGELKRPDEEVQDYDELVKRFGSSEDPDLQVQVAQALYNKGTVWQARKPKAAAAAFQQILKRFELSRNRELRELVENARVSLQDTSGADADEN